MVSSLPSGKRQWQKLQILLTGQKNYAANILPQNASLDLIWRSMASYYRVGYTEKKVSYFDWTNLVSFSRVSKNKTNL